MPPTIGFNPYFEDLKRYMVIGVGNANRPYPSFWTMVDDPTEAQYLAMAWLVSGFATRVIDNKSGQGANITPALLYNYDNLASVQTVVPALNKYCEQLVPPEINWPMSLADFQTWLVNFSQGTPTWPAATPDVPVVTA